MIQESVFNKKAIFIDKECKTKKEVFKIFSTYFVNNGYAEDINDMIEAFFNRENEGSTAFFNGLGIPHAKTKTVSKPGICVLKIKDGIDWDSMDDLQTYFFIGMAIPEIGGEVQHLKMLSSIARKLIDNKFKSNLLAATTIDEIYNLVSEIEIK